MILKHKILAAITSEPVKSLMLLFIGAAVGWVGNFVAGWWRLRDRYRAHVTWRTIDTYRGPEAFPVLIIQSIHNLPINVTGVRIRNGFCWHTRFWAFDSEDPDYPDLPITIEPMKETMLTLSSDALDRAAEQCRLLERLWVPRVYVGVRTMGRGECLLVAEGGLKWDKRRKRYQR